MTTFRLNAGRPAASQSSGSSARCTVTVTLGNAADLKHVSELRQKDYITNSPLKCGDTIPWPVIHAFGENINLIWCSEHGWQPKITKTEIDRVRREARQCQNSPTQSTLTIPPPF